MSDANCDALVVDRTHHVDSRIIVPVSEDTRAIATKETLSVEPTTHSHRHDVAHSEDLQVKKKNGQRVPSRNMSRCSNGKSKEKAHQTQPKTSAAGSGGSHHFMGARPKSSCTKGQTPLYPNSKSNTIKNQRIGNEFKGESTGPVGEETPTDGAFRRSREKHDRIAKSHKVSDSSDSNVVTSTKPRRSANYNKTNPSKNVNTLKETITSGAETSMIGRDHLTNKKEYYQPEGYATSNAYHGTTTKNEEKMSMLSSRDAIEHSIASNSKEGIFNKNQNQITVQAGKSIVRPVHYDNTRPKSGKRPSSSKNERRGRMELFHKHQAWTEENEATRTQKIDRNISNSRNGGNSQQAGRTERTRGTKPKTYNTWKRNTKEESQTNQRDYLISQMSCNNYECMVCCDVIRYDAAIWNCTNCYHAFHLRCIQKWAHSGVDNENNSGWRCPACQNICFKYPSTYMCFCGSVRDPDLNRYDVPHSCGNVCKKKRGSACRHPCNILCHPGPCPLCEADISKKCLCGRSSKKTRCSLATDFQCDAICEKVLNCGKHTCSNLCHSKLCDPCAVQYTQQCFCGKEERNVTCGTSESFTSNFSCDMTCGRTLECGQHYCPNVCHAGPCVACVLSPENVTACPCGKVPLSDLVDEGIGQDRTICTDPVPTCGNACQKLLGCGSKVAGKHVVHSCKMNCHEGPCEPCTKMSTLICRCGATEKEIPCTEALSYNADNPLMCDRKCTKKRRCGRHKCNQTCCVDTLHECQLICGRKLRCGQHKCDELCHNTKCPPCWQSSFDELHCFCGAETIFPPVPCNTKPPECSQQCTREHECEHTVYHTCHSDNKCPPCTVLVQRMCMGGHTLRNNIPCHVKDISCGMSCGKLLSCGQHTCRIHCHKGSCVQEGQLCKQACVLARPGCGHPCMAPCHVDQPCPDTPCETRVDLKCECGFRTGTLSCGNLSKRPAGYRNLDCNNECAIIKRNLRLALALEIKNPDLQGKFGNPSYSYFLKDYARGHLQFVTDIERSLSELVRNVKSTRSHSFPSMNTNQRHVVHELAEFHGCTSAAYDTEPNKNVVVTAVFDKCWLPTATLTSLTLKELEAASNAVSAGGNKDESARSVQTTSQNIKFVEKVNSIDYFEMTE